MAVLLDGTLVSGSLKDITNWDPANGELLRTFVGHTDSVNSLAVLKDGTLISGSQDKTIRVWDVKNNQTLNVLKGHSSGILALLVLPDGNVASSSLRPYAEIRIWNITSGQTVKQLTGHTNSIYSLYMLSDGLLASGSADKTIKIWNTTSGEIEKSLVQSATMFPPTIAIYSLAELPDHTLASCSNIPNIEIIIWNVKNGQQLRKLYGHKYPSKSLVVLSDGRLVSGSEDEAIRIWDTSTGQSLITLTGHTGPITSLAVLPNGYLASGSDEGIRVWNVDYLIKQKSLIINSF